MNSPSSFPAQGYRGNAELNYQVRASNKKNTLLLLSTIKTPLRILQAIRGFDYWQNFPKGSSIIAEVPGSRVGLGAVPWGSQSPSTKNTMSTHSFGSVLLDERSSSFRSPFPLASTKPPTRCLRTERLFTMKQHRGHHQIMLNRWQKNVFF